MHSLCKDYSAFFVCWQPLFWLLKHKQNQPDCRGRTQVTASESANENDAHKPSSAADYKHSSLIGPLMQNGLMTHCKWNGMTGAAALVYSAHVKPYSEFIMRWSGKLVFHKCTFNLKLNLELKVFKQMNYTDVHFYKLQLKWKTSLYE